MKVAEDWKDYELIATSNGQKLERWNDIYLLRPDPQVIWDQGDLLEKYHSLICTSKNCRCLYKTAAVFS